MKKQILLFLISGIFITNVLSQPCTINMAALKGDYTGDCKKGKAEGKGTAIGVDSYTGDFKNGYPHGYGKYTWKNGDWYDGLWKNGLFEGKGTLSKTEVTTPGAPEITTGFWKKGKYSGTFEKPYIVHSTTNNVSEVTVTELNSVNPEIIVAVKSITGGASTLGVPVLPKIKLVNIEAVEGQFGQEVPDEMSSPVTNKYSFRKITYPFYAIFSFETIGKSKSHVEKVSVEFFENCNWYVQVGIDN